MDTENRLAADSEGGRVKEARIRSLELAYANWHIYSMNKRHGPIIIQHGELYSLSCEKP